MTTIGFVTIAESPRDDVLPDIRHLLPDDIHILERGNLDGLELGQVTALAPEEGEVGIVARLKAGSEVLLSHRKILPRMQELVDELIEDEQADLVVVICGADWSELSASVPLVNPGRLFPAVVSALAQGKRLGVIKPSAGQVEQERARYQSLGIDAVVTSASPYTGESRLDLVRGAAEQIRDAECDLVWMTCIGMDGPMRAIVAEVTGKPVMLARSLIGRVVAELVSVRPA